ncbi:hypothetical protein [Aquimarina sp. SS2-1]|uniref:hypothetical protein n=1 Tax=Aquimarina besae TaxID=3342247 RepID=UPI00366F07F8
MRVSKKLKNPSDYYKIENCEYKILLTQKDFYDWILGGSGYDIDGAYKSVENYLD